MTDECLAALERAAALATIRATDQLTAMRMAERKDIRYATANHAHLAEGYWQDRFAAEMRLRAATTLLMALNVPVRKRS